MLTYAHSPGGRVGRGDDAYSPRRRAARMALSAVSGEIHLVAAEVAVGGGAGIDRTQQVEGGDDGFRTQVEMGGGSVRRSFVGNLAGAEGVDHQAHRQRPDGVSHLHFATVGQTGGDDVLAT